MAKNLLSVFLVSLIGLLPSLISAGDKPQPPKPDRQMIDNEVSNQDITELLNQADSVFRQREYTPSRKYYQKALEAAKSKGDNSGMTEAMAMIGRTYLIEKKMETAIHWINASEQLALQQEPLGWSRFQAVKGRLLWQDNKLEVATKLFKQLYQYCSDHKLYERAIDAAHMVAITGDHQQQIEWGRKGIKEAEEGGISGWLGPLWNNLGATYEEIRQFDSSLAAYQKARKYHYQHGTETNKMIADWAVGHAYLNLKDLENAEKWLTPLIIWCQKLSDTEFLGLASRDLGDINYYRGDLEKALGFYTTAEKYLREAGMEEWDPEGFKEIQARILELQ